MRKVANLVRSTSRLRRPALASVASKARIIALLAFMTGSANIGCLSCWASELSDQPCHAAAQKAASKSSRSSARHHCCAQPKDEKSALVSASKNECEGCRLTDRAATVAALPESFCGVAPSATVSEQSIPLPANIGIPDSRAQRFAPDRAGAYLRCCALLI